MQLDAAQVARILLNFDRIFDVRVTGTQKTSEREFRLFQPAHATLGILDPSSVPLAPVKASLQCHGSGYYVDGNP